MNLDYFFLIYFWKFFIVVKCQNKPENQHLDKLE